MLYLIGIGLNDEKDITIKGLEAIRAADSVYLETYTSLMFTPVEALEKYHGRKIMVVDRAFVEQADTMILEAKTKSVAFLVVGDPFGATTHIDLMLRCRQNGVALKVIHNASILTAVGITGLQIYKFGKTTSIPFPERNFQPITGYEVIRQNLILGLHTLLLLDLKPESKMFMTIAQAIKILLDIEQERKSEVFTQATFCVGVARLGSDDFVVKAGTAAELLKFDFGRQPHALIVPGELHFVEEDALNMWQ